MLATNKLFILIAGVFAIGAIIAWFFPRPSKVMETSAFY